MKWPVLLAGVALAACALNKPPPPVRAGPIVHPAGHSHNDYTRSRPLVDAIERGFCSIEADVHLVGEDLLVAHDRQDCRTNLTLRSMYLEPLRNLVRTNQGAVYPGRAEPLLLLIDLKSAGVPAYHRLHTQLLDYREMLTECDGATLTSRAITVVISGNIPRDTIAAQTRRLAFVDGRKVDLDAPTPAPTTLVPLVSMPWRSEFAWWGIGGAGPMPEAERAKLRELVERAHARGYKLRFWGTPNVETVWSELSHAGVDLISMDDLDLGVRFFDRQPNDREHGVKR